MLLRDWSPDFSFLLGETLPMPTPHCGHCQYNLTGIEDNRCPECGLLFIEAGVKIVGEGSRDRRKQLWLAALFGLFLLAGISVSYALMVRSRMQAATAQQQAAVARQRALAAQQLRIYEKALDVNEVPKVDFNQLENPSRISDEKRSGN